MAKKKKTTYKVGEIQALLNKAMKVFLADMIKRNPYDINSRYAGALDFFDFLLEFLGV